MKKRLPILFAALCLCGCTSKPTDVTLRAASDASVTVQCEDEYEPVLTVADNRTVGIVTCVKK